MDLGQGRTQRSLATLLRPDTIHERRGGPRLCISLGRGRIPRSLVIHLRILRGLRLLTLRTSVIDEKNLLMSKVLCLTNDNVNEY
jgi:hypothetical protein